MYGQGLPKSKPVATPANDDDREVSLDEWDDIVADHYRVPKNLMKSMAGQESGGDIKAVSPTGVRGRYQVTEQVAKGYGLDRNNPFQQSVAAARYLREQYEALKDVQDDDERWLGAVGRYYGGPSAVRNGELSSQSVDDLSNPAEHVRKVAEKWGTLNRGQAGAPAPQSPAQIQTGNRIIEKPVNRPVRPKPLSTDEQRNKQAAQVIRAIEAGRERAVSLFQAADRTDPGKLSTVPGGQGLPMPAFGSGNKAIREKEMLRARAEGELEAVNRLVQEAQNRYPDLIEAGYGQDTDPKSNRKWGYAKAKQVPITIYIDPETGRQTQNYDQNGRPIGAERQIMASNLGVQMYRNDSSEERAAASRPEDIERTVRQQRRIQAERERIRSRSSFGQAAEGALAGVKDFFMGDRYEQSPEDRERAAENRAATGRTNIYGEDAPSGVREVLGRFGRGAASTIASVPQGVAEQLDQLPGYLSQGARPVPMLGLTPMRVTPPGKGISGATRPYTERLERAAEALTPVDPNDESWLTAKIPEGLGSAAGFALLGGAGRLAGLNPAAVSAAVGAFGNTAEVAKEMDRAGVDPRSRDAAIALAGVTGLTEAAGLGKILQRWGLGRKFVERLFEIGEEGGQEYVQQYLNDVNAAVIGNYDPKRPLSPISRDKIEAAILGGLIGSAFQGADIAGNALAKRLQGRSGSTAPQLPAGALFPGEAAAAPQSSPQTPLSPQGTAPGAGPVATPSAAVPGKPSLATGADLLAELSRIASPAATTAAKPTLDEEISRLETEGESLSAYAMQNAAADPETATQSLNQALGRYGKAIKTLEASPEYQNELIAIARGEQLDATPYRDRVTQLKNAQAQLENFATQQKQAEVEQQRAEKLAQAEAEKQAKEAEAQAKRAEIEQQRALKAQERAEQQAAENERRQQLADEAMRVADESAARIDQLIEQGDVPNAIGELRARQQTLRSALKYLPETAEGIRRRAEITRQIEAINPRINDLKRRGAEQARPQTASRATPLLESIVNPEGGNPQLESIYEPGARFLRLAEEAPDLQEETPNLLTAIRRAGGIRSDGDTTGELRRLGLKEGGTTGLLNNKSGVAIDRMREMMVSEGLSRAETVAEFYDEIEQEMRAAQNRKGREEDDLSAYYENLPEDEELPEPPTRIVRVGDEEVELTPEQAARWAAEVDEPLRESEERYRRDMASTNPRVREEAGRRRKADAMRIAAKKREIADRLTGKEQVARAAAPIAEPSPAEAPAPAAQPAGSFMSEFMDDLDPEEAAALRDALDRYSSDNPRDYADRTRPGEPGSGGVSFSPYSMLVANNREQVNQLYGLDLRSDEAIGIIDGLREYAVRNDIEMRHLHNLLNAVRNDQLERARFEDRGLSYDDIQIADRQDTLGFLEEQESSVNEEISRESARLDDEEVEFIRQVGRDIDDLLLTLHEDADMMEFFEAAVSSEKDYPAFEEGAVNGYGFSAETARYVVEQERTARRPRSPNRGRGAPSPVQTETSRTDQKRGDLRSDRQSQSQIGPDARLTAGDYDLLSRNLTTIPDAELDDHLRAVENLRNLGIRGPFFGGKLLEPAEERQIRAVLDNINGERTLRRDADAVIKRLGTAEAIQAEYAKLEAERKQIARKKREADAPEIEKLDYRLQVHRTALARLGTDQVGTLGPKNTPGRIPTAAEREARRRLDEATRGLPQEERRRLKAELRARQNEESGGASGTRLNKQQLADAMRDQAAKKEDTPTVTHPDPALDQQPILAERADGRVVIANPENKSGISVVKDRSGEETEHKFSSTQVNLPQELANRVRDFSKRIPDADLAENGREDEPHVTIKYGLHGSRAGSVREILEGAGRIKAKLGRISLFTDNPEFDVVKIEVESEDLRRLNEALAEGVPNTEKFPEYNPHVTIAYVKKGRGDKYVGNRSFLGQNVEFDQVKFSGREGNQENIRVAESAKEAPKPAWAPIPADAKLTLMKTPIRDPRSGFKGVYAGVSRQTRNTLLMLTPEGDQVEVSRDRAQWQVEKAEQKSATEAAKDTVKETAKGLDSALKGLGELFGGKNKLSAGFTFDEDTYAAAKPHFQEAYGHFKAAVSSTAEIGRALVRLLRQRGFPKDAIDRMRPYIDRFASEQSLPIAESVADAQEMPKRLAALDKEINALARRSKLEDLESSEDIDDLARADEIRSQIIDKIRPAMREIRSMRQAIEKEMERINEAQEKVDQHYAALKLQEDFSPDIAANLKKRSKELERQSDKLDDALTKLNEQEADWIDEWVLAVEPSDVEAARQAYQGGGSYTLFAKTKARAADRALGLRGKYELTKPKFVADAEQRLRDAAQGKLAGAGFNQMADIAIVTGYRIYRKGMTYAQWAKAMIREVGEDVRPHLKKAWDSGFKNFAAALERTRAEEDAAYQHYSDLVEESESIDQTIASYQAKIDELKRRRATVGTRADNAYDDSALYRMQAETAAKFRIGRKFYEPGISFENWQKATEKAAEVADIARGTFTRDLYDQIAKEDSPEPVNTSKARRPNRLQAVNEGLAASQKKLADLEAEDQALTDQIKDLEERLSDIDDERESLEERFTRPRDEDAEDEIDDFLSKEEYKAARAELATQLKSVKAELRRLERQSSRLSHSIEDAAADVDTFKTIQEGEAWRAATPEGRRQMLMDRLTGKDDSEIPYRQAENGDWYLAYWDKYPAYTAADIEAAIQDPLHWSQSIDPEEVGPDVIAWSKKNGFDLASAAEPANAPNDPASWSYFGTPRVEKAPTTKEEIDELIGNVRSEFRQKSNSAGTVWVNQQATMAISLAAERLKIEFGNATGWIGVSLSLRSTRRIMDYLNQVADDYGKAGSNLVDLVENMREGLFDAYANAKAGIVFAEPAGSKSELKATLREERFHQWQQSNDLLNPLITGALHVALRGDPVYDHIVEQLVVNEGYLDRPTVLAVEVPAKIASGQWAAYNLESAAQGDNLLHRYFRAAAQLLGPEVLLTDAPGTARARGVQQDVREILGIEKGATIQRGGLRQGIQPRQADRNQSGDPNRLAGRIRGGRGRGSETAGGRPVSGDRSLSRRPGDRGQTAGGRPGAEPTRGRARETAPSGGGLGGRVSGGRGRGSQATDGRQNARTQSGDGRAAAGGQRKSIANAARRALGAFSVGPLEGESSGGTILGAGLGSLQAWTTQPTKPRAQVALPVGWDLSKWARNLHDQLQEGVANGKISNKRATKILEAIREVSAADAAGDGIALFIAREKLSRLTGEKFRLADLAELPRTIKAGLDFSFMFRQGGAYNYPGLFLRPIETIERIYKGATAVTEQNYAEVNAQIAARPLFNAMMESGLHLINQKKLEGNKLTDREEGYISRLAQNAPVYKQTERANATILDLLRADVFERYAAYLNKNGITFENNPKAFKQMAHFINVMTGRGSLGENFDKAAPFLSLALFAPRWIASRVNLLNMAVNPLEYRKLDPAVRRLVWRDLGAYAGALGLTLGVLAAAAHYGLLPLAVGLDPDDPDFGKVILFGKYRYDLTSGLSQYLVFGTRMAKAFYRRYKGEKLRDSQQPSSIALRFLRGKASPAGSFIADATTGKNYMGEPFELKSAVADQFYPLVIKDFMEGYNLEGVSGGLMSLPATVGVGYGVYEKGGQAAKVPELAKEAEEQDVYFAEGRVKKLVQRKLEEFGAPKEIHEKVVQESVARRRKYVEQFGPILINSDVYKQAAPEDKAALLKKFNERSEDLATLNDPDLSKLDPASLEASINESKKSRENTSKREAATRVWGTPQNLQ